MTKHLTLLLFIGLAWGQNPCEDERYLELKTKTLDEMSDREYQYFLTYDEECSQYQKSPTIVERAVNDATADASKWLFYQPLIIGISGASSLSYFFFTGEPSVIVSILSLSGSYSLFTASDENNIVGVSSKDFELYEKIYFKEFKKRKFKNIIISTGVLGIIATAVTFNVFSNLNFGDGIYLP